jgi:hypothetical protein
MKKPITEPAFAAVLVCLIAFSITAYCQPNIQTTGVRVPVDIKIDGNATEWGDKLQAYNKATNIYYTIANDDNKLYLTIKATDPTIITKIVSAGITFTINAADKKEEKTGVAITFPAYDKNDKSLYLLMENKPAPVKDANKSRMQLDSFMNVLNSKLADHLKMIGITGTKTIPDNTISVYNEQGIRAAALFDNKINYTYELSIPLKYLDVIGVDKFSYNIKLNGQIPAGSTMVDVGRPDRMLFTGPDGITYSLGKATPENLILAYPTDFWGEYILAKK